MSVHELKSKGWKAELVEITQKQLEEYFVAYREQRPEKASGTEDRGAVVRAAAHCGWLKGDWDVDNLPPAQVRWLAAIIDDAYAQATAIPPE